MKLFGDVQLLLNKISMFWSNMGDLVWFGGRIPVFAFTTGMACHRKIPSLDRLQWAICENASFVIHVKKPLTIFSLNVIRLNGYGNHYHLFVG